MAVEIQKSGFVNGRRIPVISPALTLTVFANRREKVLDEKIFFLPELIWGLLVQVNGKHFSRSERDIICAFCFFY
jgi:hypothetical protein